MCGLERPRYTTDVSVTQQTQNVPLMEPIGPMRLFFGEPNKNVIGLFHVGSF